MRREKKINKKSEEKRLFSLWRKRLRLSDAKRNLNFVKLETPIRSGYKKFFVLREDFARSKDSHIYLSILPYIQKVVYSRSDKFLSKDFKTKKWIDIPHNLSTINHKTWNQISNDLTESQKNLFDIFWRQMSNANAKIGRWEYRLKKQFMFVPKIEPHYKTHSIILDPELESDLQKIDNKIEREYLMPKIGKYFGWSNRYDDYDTRKNRLIERLYEKEAANILEYNQYDI